MSEKKKVYDELTPELLRGFLQGLGTHDQFTPALLAQLQKIARQVQRRAARTTKREHKAQHYRNVALLGGGPREVARRRRQMA